MTDAEFHYALSRLRSGTAAGDDGVYTEMVTHLGPVGLQWLRKLLSRSLSSGIVRTSLAQIKDCAHTQTRE